MFLIVEFEILKLRLCRIIPHSSLLICLATCYSHLATKKFEILNFCDKRAQRQTRLNYAERSKNQMKF